MTKDPLESVAVLLPVGVDRILTSGGAADAIAGAATIRRMVDLVQARGYAGRTAVVPGGGISVANVAGLVQLTNVRMVHASLRSKQEVRPSMLYRRADTHFAPEWAWRYRREGCSTGSGACSWVLRRSTLTTSSTLRKSLTPP